MFWSVSHLVPVLALSHVAVAGKLPEMRGWLYRQGP
ncbi:hypothetical protein A359_05350 [secondary endosymbiont of Ctenarytaina eucalypti]|uniref:Uncharacterized protein n=1 Tax=secondary endosymbiont of Ctenarytaina eucalypti TaxID=1199245 RepID=J3TFE9_9ENTR|nr:hypothetical protein A359_05350 [secondary endosymbiont of Ctenarytaina eucalypti]